MDKKLSQAQEKVLQEIRERVKMARYGMQNIHSVEDYYNWTVLHDKNRALMFPTFTALTESPTSYESCRDELSRRRRVWLKESFGELFLTCINRRTVEALLRLGYIKELKVVDAEEVVVVDLDRCGLNSKRGGHRDGAGRKPNLVPKVTWSVKVTEEERAYLQQCLKEFRSK